MEENSVELLSRILDEVKKMMSKKKIQKIFFLSITAAFLLSSCGYSQKEFDEAIDYAYEDGMSSGYDDGYDDGHFDGKSEGYTEGWNDGYIDGYQDRCFDSKYGDVEQEENTGSNTGNLIKNSYTVYITDSGDNYHKFGCQYLEKSMHKTTLSYAKQKGYAACSRCFR